MAYNFPQELVLVGTQNLNSAGSSVSFTTGISSNFTNYVLKCRNVIFTTANVWRLALTYSTNGGSTYLSTGYKSMIVTQSTLLDDDTTTTAFWIMDDLQTGSTYGSNCDATLYNLTNTQVKTVYSFSSTPNSTQSAIATGIQAGVQTGTTAINAIQLAPLSSTMTGNFYLYGII